MVMISIYSGTVGSGKSYHGTELALEWLNRGKHVVANYPILPPKRCNSAKAKAKWAKKSLRWHFYEFITVEVLVALSFENNWYGKESQCLIEIDEAGVMFNTRDWQTEKNTRTPWIKWLSQSRKFGYDVVFVAQSDKMIDKQIRGLVEYNVVHFKLSNSFFFSWLKWLKISLFLYNYKWYQTKLPGNKRFGLYRPSIANRYDTMRTFNLEELTQQIEELYKGSIIPAPVLIQLTMWKQNIFDRSEQLKNPLGLTKIEEAETPRTGGAGVPSGGAVTQSDNYVNLAKY
jgi:zona occludens toxin